MANGIKYSEPNHDFEESLNDGSKSQRDNFQFASHLFSIYLSVLLIPF